MVCCWVPCPAVSAALRLCTEACSVSLIWPMAARFCRFISASFASACRFWASSCWCSHSFSAASSRPAVGFAERYSSSAIIRQMATSRKVYRNAKNSMCCLSHCKIRALLPQSPDLRLFYFTCSSQNAVASSSQPSASVPRPIETAWGASAKAVLWYVTPCFCRACSNAS